MCVAVGRVRQRLEAPATAHERDGHWCGWRPLGRSFPSTEARLCLQLGRRARADRAHEVSSRAADPPEPALEVEAGSPHPARSFHV